MTRTQNTLLSLVGACAIFMGLFFPLHSAHAAVGDYTNFSFDTAASGNDSPSGITWDGTYFWVVDLTDAEVYKYDSSGVYQGFSFDTAASGNAGPSGITWDGTYFWVVDFNDDEVYKYDSSGVYQSFSFDTAASGNANPIGITWDGTYFWMPDEVDAEVYKYNSSGVYQNFSFDTTPSGITGSTIITWDGTFFWVGDNNDQVNKYNPAGIYQSFSFDTAASGNDSPIGITWDGTYFWVVDLTDDEVYRYEGTTCTVSMPWIGVSCGTLSKPANKLGLVGYWSFDEGNGTTATDASGLGNLGTISGAQRWTSGKRGKALELDGSSLVRINGLVDKVSSGAATVAMWFRPAATFSSASVSDQILFSLSDAVSVNDLRFRLDETDGSLDWETGHAGIDALPSTQLIWESGKWYFITGTISANGGEKILYINSIAQNQDAPGARGSPIATEARIGAIEPDTDYFVGAVDEVRVYNRALSASEVAAIYRSGAVKVGASSADLSNGTRLSNGLVGHWTFDGVDFTNTGIVDRSGNGNTGYLVALATSSAKAAGKLGQAFNPVSVGRINLGSQASLSNLGPMTVCTWERVPDSIATDYQQLFDTSNDGGATNGQGLYMIGSGNVGGAGFGFTNLDGDSAEYHNAVVNNGWHHLCAMWDGTDTSANIKLFLDGELVTVTAFYNDGFPNADDSTHDKYIGALSNGTFQSRILIDDMRIYNRMLSNSEVRQLYNLGTVKIIP